MSARLGWPRPGITGRLSLVFVLFAAALLTAVTWYSYSRGGQALRGAALAGLASTAVEKEGALGAWVAEMLSDMQALAGDPHLPADVAAVLGGGPAAQEAHDRMVADLRARTGGGAKFVDLLVMEPGEGRVIAATDRDEQGKYREDRPFFVQGRQGPFVQGLHYSLQRRGPATVVTVPLRAADGRLVAVLAGRPNLARLNDIVTRRTGIHGTDDAYLVNRENLVVTTPRLMKDAAVLQSGVRLPHVDRVNRENLVVTTPRLMKDAAVLQSGVRLPHVDRCLEGESGSVTATDYRGIPVLAVFRWIPDRQLCLVVKLDQAEALAPVVALRDRLLLFGGGALLVASVVAAVLGRAITRPVRRLTAGAGRIGRGDLAARLPETSRDELGALAREFNAMAAALAEREQRLGQAAAELRASNRELEAFSYSVSHDLRAPLRALDGFSRILLERHAPALSDEARRYFGMIRDNAVQMGRLVDDLLRFSRLGRQALETRGVEPGEIVRLALEDLAGAHEGRRVKVTLGALPPCQADPTLLRQVFVNLLANALKFTGRREVAEIEVGCHEGDGERAYFVRDNGAGFDMRYADKLFGVFQRLHRAEEFEGTGVGLAIVQRIVHRHGGRIWAEAAVDRGATFHFTLGGDSRG